MFSHNFFEWRNIEGSIIRWKKWIWLISNSRWLWFAGCQCDENDSANRQQFIRFFHDTKLKGFLIRTDIIQIKDIHNCKQKKLNEFNLPFYWLSYLSNRFIFFKDDKKSNIYYFCKPLHFKTLKCNQGEMAEWSNAAVSKTVVRLPANRGFESPSLRKDNTNHPQDCGWFLFYP